MWTAKTLTTLGRCQGRSESSLDTKVALLVLLCCGSFDKIYQSASHNNRINMQNRYDTLQFGFSCMETEKIDKCVSVAR